MVGVKLYELATTDYDDNDDDDAELHSKAVGLGRTAIVGYYTYLVPSSAVYVQPVNKR